MTLKRLPDEGIPNMERTKEGETPMIEKTE